MGKMAFGALNDQNQVDHPITEMVIAVIQGKMLLLPLDSEGLDLVLLICCLWYLVKVICANFISVNW